MVGATMGAGIGRLEGLYGLMADSLLSAYLMLPDTTVIEVSATQEPELFWGLRGAGFNFGFVLNATYRIYDAAPGGMNLNADFAFPASAARSFYQAIHDNVATMAAPLCIATALTWNPSLNMVSP
jgi:FAD/FMN-containing dehydrogenase